MGSIVLAQPKSDSTITEIQKADSMRTRWLNSTHIVKPCWICLTVPPRVVTPPLEKTLKNFGFTNSAHSEHCYLLKTEENWNIPWRNISAWLSDSKLASNAQVGILAGQERPSAHEISLHSKPIEETDDISKHLWVVDAITHASLTTHFQPVMDRRGQIFGYEALVRGAKDDGSTASGGAILAASKVLRIEHLIDRHLHELAIKTYAQRGLSGFLFINFIPGFIQRPEYYLEGLTQTALQLNVNAKHIVLDCTNSEHPRDMQQMKSIFKYCQSRGYQVCLDDIESVHTARRILKEMRPDFIKLGMKLVQRVRDPDAMDTIYQLIDLTKTAGSTLIAEGVENSDIHQKLLDMGITLFQGYLFSPPGYTTPHSVTPTLQTATPDPATKRSIRKPK